MTVNFEQLCQDFLPTIRETGLFILGNMSQTENINFEIKGRDNIVSYVDREAEVRLIKKAKQLLPDAGFLTEEKTVEQSDGKYQWMIDPLDGTTNFYYNIPFFAISIALTLNDRVAMGIVYDVTNDDMFYAWRDGGAFMNGVPISTSEITDSCNAFVATGIPNSTNPDVEQYLGTLKRVIGCTRGIRRLGSAALELAYVAAGRLDAFFEFGLSPWDVAAGAILVNEAGGTVTDFNGNNSFMSNQHILATSKGIHEQLLLEIQKDYT